MMICVLLLAALYDFDFEAVSRGRSCCRTDFAISHRDPSQVTDTRLRVELRAPRSFRLVFYRKIGGIVR